VTTDVVTRPDGAEVALDYADPLRPLGQLVQEDFCILQKQGEEHVLTGALLYFFGQMDPVGKIHATVGHDPRADRQLRRRYGQTGAVDV